MVEQKDQTGEEANTSDTVPPASYCNSHCSHGAHSSKLQQQYGKYFKMLRTISSLSFIVTFTWLLE